MTVDYVKNMSHWFSVVVDRWVCRALQIHTNEGGG
jgi:hypothetical protein